MIIRLMAIVLACLTAAGCAGDDASSRSAAPLPAAARGLPVPPDKGYTVGALGDGLFWVTDGVYQAMFMTTGRGVIVVDAPPTFADKMLRAIAETTKERITHVIYSHAHADHIGAASLYPKNATYIAHADTRARLIDADGKDRPEPYGAFVGGQPVPRPTVTFERRYVLRVGRQELRLESRGDDHEPGNIYIYAPRQKVLMKVDIVFPGWTPFMELALAENVRGFIKAHDEILGYDFDWLVGGHYGRLATRADVETQRDYVHDMQANAVTALRGVDFAAIAARTGPENLALLFDTYLNAVAARCAELTLAKWQARLGGADIWTAGHCRRIAESLRVD